MRGNGQGWNCLNLHWMQGFAKEIYRGEEKKATTTQYT